MTLEKPPTTLGENQFESFSLFSEYCFYSETEITQQKKLQQPHKCTYLKNRAQPPPRFRAKQKQKFTAENTALNVVRTTPKIVSK